MDPKHAERGLAWVHLRVDTSSGGVAHAAYIPERVTACREKPEEEADNNARYVRFKASYHSQFLSFFEDMNDIGKASF